MKCVFFDFDGTLTDIEHHAPLYQAAFRDELAARAKLSPDALDRAWAIAAATVDASNGEIGWTFDGHVVAPAAADPYLYTNAVARLILLAEATIADETHGQVIYEAYRAAYRKIPTQFRAETADVIEAVVAKGCRVFVVTNAMGDDVIEKLKGLSLRAETRAKLAIRGDARKFEITPPSSPNAAFDALPATVAIAGLVRPVLLGRGRYFDVLQSIWIETGTTPEATIMCGDVFELDLALPHALGANVQLVTHARTLPHEKAATAALARGGVGAGLLPVLERI